MRNAIGRMIGMKGAPPPPEPPKFGPPLVPTGVIPAAEKLAMDSAVSGTYDYANSHLCGIDRFPGYPLLAQLTQRAEYRNLAEKKAEAMTRKWIEFKGTSDRITELKKELERLNIRELFGECAKQEAWFGRVQLFVDLGEHSGPALADPMIMAKETLYGKLRKFKLIEAMYTYPVDYVADNPMSDSYYNPRRWYVMGNLVHTSRLLMFAGRKLPDVLKPAYNFGGISLSQLAEPYVNNWLSTRDHVNRMIRNYSIVGLKTNMQNVLAGDMGDNIVTRAELYNVQRDNQGMFMIDKDSEDMFLYQSQLTNLDKLQAQSQEHMCAVSSMPLIVAYGISPTGLNASSEGEIRVWYDHILDEQENLFRDPLQTVMEIIQLSVWGDVDDSIEWGFVPLWEPNKVEAAQIRKTNAETASILVNDVAAITNQEVRDAMVADPDSGYTGLKAAAPEPPEPENDDPTRTKDDPAETNEA